MAWQAQPTVTRKYPGAGVDSLGLGVDSLGLGVDSLGPGNSLPERQKVRTSRRSRLQPAKLPATKKELAFSWVPPQVVFCLPDDLWRGFQPCTLIPKVALVKLAIKMAVSAFSQIFFPPRRTIKGKSALSTAVMSRKTSP